MLNPNKYIVLRRSNLSRNLIQTIEDENLAIEDAVVIRKQDVFAEAGLHAYAANVLTGIEMLALFPNLAQHIDVEHLQDLADFFHEQAVSCSQDTFFRKLPD